MEIRGKVNYLEKGQSSSKVKEKWWDSPGGVKRGTHKSLRTRTPSSTSRLCSQCDWGGKNPASAAQSRRAHTAPAGSPIGCEMTSPIQVYWGHDWSAEGLGGAKKERGWVKPTSSSWKVPGTYSLLSLKSSAGDEVETRKRSLGERVWQDKGKREETGQELGFLWQEVFSLIPTSQRQREIKIPCHCARDLKDYKHVKFGKLLFLSATEYWDK
jgi:hypothetical protein